MKAGRSLGFDLSGSLAAINQWVEDMDTGGSSEEESDSAPTTRNMPNSIATNSSVHSDGGVRCNLISASGGEQEKATADPHVLKNAFKDEKSETSSHGSRSYNSSNREILSRQKILSMVCSEL